MFKALTESGSIYEIDTKENKVRRLHGVESPQPRQGKDGEWKPYMDLIPSTPTVGKCLTFFWYQTDPIDCLFVPATQTSLVTQLI